MSTELLKHTHAISIYSLIILKRLFLIFFWLSLYNLVYGCCQSFV